MYSGVSAVLLVASVGYICGGAQVPIISYVCTQPNSPNDDGACNVSNGLRHCVITNGVRPTLLHYTDGDNTVPYRWVGIISPFVVLDIPQGWCVSSVKMEFKTASARSTPFVNVTIHNMTQLSNNSLTVQAMYSGGTEDPSVVLNLTSLTCGRYIRIDMSHSMHGHVLLTEIAVFGNITPTPPPSASDNSTLHATSPSSSATSTVTSPLQTTTSVSSSSFTITLTSPLSSTSVTSISSNTSDPGLSPSQSLTGPSPAVSVEVVLPAAVSGAAVLLLLVLIVIFVIVICIAVRRHNSRKSLMMHRLSIHYQNAPRRKSSDTFRDDHQFVVGQQEKAELAILDANSAADEKYDDGEIRDAPHNYAAVGPAESNDNIAQGAAEEPVAEGDNDRPPSQESIRSNEVSSKLTYGKVTWVHPSTLDHPYDSCNKGNTTAASGGGDHYETPDTRPLAAEGPYDLPTDGVAEGENPAREVGTSPPVNSRTSGGIIRGQFNEWCDPPSENTYELPPDCKLLEEEPTMDSGYRVLNDAATTASSRQDMTHDHSHQGAASTLPLVDHTYESPTDTVTTPKKEKRREPDPSDVTYESVDYPSTLPTLAAAQPPKRNSPPKPSPPAQSVPHEDHIYSAVDKTRKTSASSKKSPAASLTPSTDAAHIYTAVDKSHKVSASSGMPPFAGLTHSTDAAHVYSEVDRSRNEDGRSDDLDALDDDFWGGSGTVERDAIAEPQNLTSNTTAQGAVPTQEVDMGNTYAEVDFSKKKKSKKGKKK